jgi:hypothetical protein
MAAHFQATEHKFSSHLTVTGASSSNKLLLQYKDLQARELSQYPTTKLLFIILRNLRLDRDSMP